MVITFIIGHEEFQKFMNISTDKIQKIRMIYNYETDKDVDE
jgi:hypothetical protein